MVRFLVALVALAGIAFTSTLQSADWPVFRGNPLQNGVCEAKLPEKLEVVWTLKTKDSIEGAPAIVNGIVYVGSYDQYLYAVKLTTGEVKWKQKLAPIKAAPSVKDDKVYVGDVDGKFYCLNASDGKTLWTFESGGEITAGANFVGEKILFGSHDSTLYCLDKEGKKLWEFRTEGPVNGSPAVIGEKTFVAGCDSNLHIIDTKTGTELASIDLGGQAGATGAIFDDKLYVGTMTNQVLAIDLKKEKIEWKYEAVKRAMPFYASAAVTNEYVVVGGRDKRVHVLDRKSGEIKWEFLTESKVDSSPVVVGNRVIVGSMDSNLYILDLKKRTELQRIELDSPVIGSPAVSGEYVLVGTEKGTLYCLGKKSE